MITVMVVDDHAVVRAGLLQVLSMASDIEVVAQAADGAEAIAFMTQHAPSVVLMDLSMPRLDGVEATRLILRRWPATRIVALSSFSDRERVVSVLDAGACGYLVKDSTPDDLIRGVRSAAEGGAPLSPNAAALLLRDRAQRSDAADLTEREREVLRPLAHGLSNRKIAELLGISEATVKAHLTHIYQALRVADRTGAAIRAHQLGLVEDALELDATGS